MHLVRAKADVAKLRLCSFSPSRGVHLPGIEPGTTDSLHPRVSRCSTTELEVRTCIYPRMYSKIAEPIFFSSISIALAA